MNKHINVRGLNRRNFLKTTAGLTFALTLAPNPLAFIDEAAADAPYAPSVWLTIGTDGIITVVSPAAEMGQGSFTTLPVIIAEELDADWAKVRPIFPSDWDDKKFGNPAYNQHVPDLCERFVWGYFTAVAHCGRTGAARAARRSRGEMGRTGRRAFDRAQRRRAQGLGTPHRLRRDRGLRQGAGRDAEDRREGPQADGKLPPHRQGHCACRAAAQGHGRGEIRAWTRRFPAWSTPPCCNRLTRAARR